MTTTNNLGTYSPRGERRIIYVSDPSSIARNYLPDPVSEDDLRSWVDELADAGTDTFIQETYTQGWTVYWRGDRFEYDARPQHRRFLPLLDAGVQPLQVLLERSHERGMEFMAGIRVNDNHGHISVEQGVGSGSSFVTENPQWHLEEKPSSGRARLSTHMDFTFSEVRDYVFEVASEIVEQFDVDGLELCFRDHGYFPMGAGRERMPLMTGLVARIGEMLKGKSAGRGKKLELGVRVHESMEECLDTGLDVPTWISDGLVTYVAPQQVMYTATNALFDEFGELARVTDCMMYPGLLPWTSVRRRRRLGDEPITLDQYRAAAQNCYGAGADGLSFYNHMVTIEWMPSYPMMLFEMDELRDPERVAQGRRHYLFEPMLAGSKIFGDGRAATGALKADRAVVSRDEPGATGTYRFRICEDLSNVRRASLVFRGYHMTDRDEIEVRINGTEIPGSSIRSHGNEKRIDMAAAVDRSSNGTLGVSPVPEIPGPWMTYWFRLTSPPAVYGDNEIEVKLTSGDPDASEDILIDEIEVLVAP